MVDTVKAGRSVPGEAAEQALAFLAEMSPDLRGAAILDDTGAVLAATDEAERWREDVATLLDVANRAGDEQVEQVHIATEQGEVFAIRTAGLVAVAVTERFALASVLLFDLRSILRDLAAGGDGRAGGDGLRAEAEADPDEGGDADGESAE
jgi:predicted regulator of Ras-like GTPase activity (Roadblock/LC7/MglB family)